jgi:hypothetical protein
MMRVVDLGPLQLLPGESAEPTGLPLVHFDEEMNVERPEEYIGIPPSSMPSNHRPWLQSRNPSREPQREDLTLFPQFEGDNMICSGWVIDTVDGPGALSASEMSSFLGP